ncbi:MAG: T9SS type A sorting domain-containing protein [Bacteroidales bacterium]|nr:T9SS type A sorting domain-containing protein [Bacteroidales bacterium]
MSDKKDNINKLFRFFHFVTLCFILPCLQVLNAQSDDEISSARKYLKTRGEVILRFRLPDALTIHELTSNLSIDNKKGDTITAYASEKQFNWLLDNQISFKVVLPRSLANPLQHHEKSTARNWDAYPSYPDYFQMMESFTVQYPGQCILHEFGTSVNGRKLLAVKISDNPAEDEPEPVFLYTSTIHGDEGAGFVLTLRLIDSLLTAYNSNSMIKQLVDNTEIWINPLSNPDGFYFNSDTFSFNSKRFNLNNVDLNRNYPDPVAGDHPDGHEWQPENVAMMKFMKEQRIILSANLHDGAELVNYPWDCRFARHADDDWYHAISRQFADSVQQYGPKNFFTDEDNGITNGYDWYSIYGGRQDYVNHFIHGREVTVELSHIKSPDPSLLPAYWEYYKRSLIGYILHIQSGVHGTVADALSGESLEAMIEIPGYDKDSSQVFSSAETGEFYRLLASGDYSFTVKSPGYQSRQIEFSLTEKETKMMAVSLLPATTEFSYFPNPVTNTLSLILSDESKNDLSLTFYDITGRITRRNMLPGIQGFATITGLASLARGIYLVKIEHGSLIRTIKITKTP